MRPPKNSSSKGVDKISFFCYNIRFTVLDTKTKKLLDHHPMTQYWHTIVTQWRVLVGATLASALLAFIVVALVPPKFQSEFRVLVVHNTADNVAADPSASVNAATHLTTVLARAVHTTSFFSKVQEAPFDVRKEFSTDPIVRQKQWRDIINVTVMEDSGMIRLRVRDGSRTTAEATANGIAYVLTNKNADYRGTNDGLTVRMIDGPTTPLTPTLPRIAPWTIAGGGVGLVAAVIVVVFFPRVVPTIRSRVHKKTHDESTRDDLIFVQKRDDDPVNPRAIAAHFTHIADATPTVAEPEARATIAEDTAAAARNDAEVEDLYAQIDAFHKNMPEE